MTAVDWVALVILASSLIMGLMRGFVREAFSLAAWVLAFLAARLFSPAVATLMPGLGQEGVRQAVAIVVVFVAVLILAQLLGAALAKLMRVAGLGGVDRMLGMLFGFGRAVVILILLTLAAGLTALPSSEVWRTAVVHRPLEIVALKVVPWLPKDLAALIRFA
jgi:membrane protein required for colicin V production